MTLRTRSNIVVFKHPFLLKGIDRVLPPGGYRVVTDEELIAATKEIGAAEGIFCAPEGAACLPALRKLIASGAVQPDELRG